MPFYPPQGYGQREVEAGMGLMNPMTLSPLLGYLSNFDRYAIFKDQLMNLLGRIMKTSLAPQQKQIAPELVDILKGARLRESEMPANKLTDLFRNEQSDVRKFFRPAKEYHYGAIGKGVPKIVSIPSTQAQLKESLIGETDKLSQYIQKLEDLAKEAWGY